MDDREVIDIVFVRASGESRSDDLPPPAKQQTQLFPNIYLGRHTNELWEAVWKGCIPPGYNFEPTRWLVQRYALWNTSPARPSECNFDPNQRLATAVALSRLVHPTSIGFKYSARVTYKSNKIGMIVPGPVSGPLADAYVVPGSYDWLSDDDASVLSRLCVDFAQCSAELPPRLKRAFWNCEYAFALEWVDLRWGVVATALESLIHTDRYRSTRQFVDRVTELADRLSVGFTGADAKRAYDLRSSVAHGQGFQSLDDQTLALYSNMEAVLRCSIRRAIEDATFRDLFLSEDTIRAEFPLKPAKNPQGSRKIPGNS